MRTEQEIRQAMSLIKDRDAMCPVLAHKQGRTCADMSHAIYGTYLAVLAWVLGEYEPLWRPPGV